MKRNDRELLERRYNHFYSRVTEAEVCVYCGDIEECLDHCPPLVWVGDLGSNHFIDKGVEFSLVPSCLECNAILGCVGLFSIVERRAFVCFSLSKKYEKLLAAPEWAHEEISNLGFALQTVVKAKQAAARFIRRRIEFSSSTHSSLMLTDNIEDVCNPSFDEDTRSNPGDGGDGDCDIYCLPWLRLEEWAALRYPDVSYNLLVRWAQKGWIHPRAEKLDGAWLVVSTAKANPPGHEIARISERTGSILKI